MRYHNAERRTEHELTYWTMKKDEMTTKATTKQIRLHGGRAPPKKKDPLNENKTVPPSNDDLPEQGSRPVHGENAKAVVHPLHHEKAYQCIDFKANN